MKQLLVLGVIAALLLVMAAPAVALSAPEEIGYNNYSTASNKAARSTFAVVGNLTTALFGGTSGFTNARYLAMFTVNSSFAGGNGSEANAIIFGAIAADPTAQDNLATGFKYLGNNSSQVVCGSYLNTTETLVGNCNRYVGLNGTSAMSRAKRNILGTDFNNANSEAKLYARDLTTMLKGLMTAYITTQRGQVAVLDNTRDIVT